MTLTIQDLGALGEFFGSIAVLVTLVYLTLQIRRSNALALAESLRFSNHAATPAVVSIAQDTDLARLFGQGLRDRSSLNPDEQVRFDMVLGNLIGGLSSSIVDQMTLGFYGSDAAPNQRVQIQQFLSSPGGAAWWSLYGAGFAPMFQRFVAEKVRPRQPHAA